MRFDLETNKKNLDEFLQNLIVHFIGEHAEESTERRSSVVH